MTKLFVKPADGLKVRNPRGGHLPAKGAEVTLSPFWTRRLNAGDVVETTKPKNTTPKKEP